MNTTNLVLLIWAVACLGVAAASARAWRTTKSWKWVDPVYYPLAILGVVLLFISNNATRTLVDLRDELAHAEQLIADNKAMPPAAAGAAAARGMAEQARLEASRQAILDRIAAMQTPVPDTVVEWIVGFAVSHLWPFVLVGALALKFAKGIAAL